VAGGTFTLTFGAQTTAALAWNANAAAVQTAVDGLSSVASATVTFSAGSAACSGGGIGIIVTFPAMVGDQAAMTSAVAALGNALEVQALTCTGTFGTFTLTFGAQTTAALAWNTNAAAVQNTIYRL